MLKNYKIGFNAWALVLFLAVMLPNFYWAAVPAANDILRTASVTKTLDMLASIFQVMMVASLCIVFNKNCKKIGLTSWIMMSIISWFLYLLTWVFYYGGATNTWVILALCTLPCLAFLFFIIDRKNWIALCPLAIFSVLHLIYGIANFVLS